MTRRSTLRLGSRQHRAGTPSTPVPLPGLPTDNSTVDAARYRVEWFNLQQLQSAGLATETRGEPKRVRGEDRERRTIDDGQ